LRHDNGAPGCEFRNPKAMDASSPARPHGATKDGRERRHRNPSPIKALAVVQGWHMADEHTANPKSRAERYRQFAQIARARAEQSSVPELRDAFARLADGWNQLADQAENATRPRES
jgi:hypothetical protein